MKRFSLLPDTSSVERERWLRAAPWARISWAITILCAGLFAMSVCHRHVLLARARQAEFAIEQLISEATEHKRLALEYNALASRVRSAEHLRDTLPVAAVIGCLTELASDGIVFDELVVMSRDGRRAVPGDAGVAIRILGHAQNESTILAYVGALSESPYLRRVKMEPADAHGGKSSARGFVIAADMGEPRSTVSEVGVP